jgi:hypothetical protein
MTNTPADYCKKFIQAIKVFKRRPKLNSSNLQQRETVVLALDVLQLRQDVNGEPIGLAPLHVAAVHIVTACQDDTENFPEN